MLSRCALKIAFTFARMSNVECCKGEKVGNEEVQ